MFAYSAQGELAAMFNKSRMTISKLLRPESIAKTKALATSGVRLAARRCRSVQHPEFERRLYEALGMGARVVSKGEIIEKAATLARDMRINDMEISSNWCQRFVKQHDLVLGQNTRKGESASPPNAVAAHLHCPDRRHVNQISAAGRALSQPLAAVQLTAAAADKAPLEISCAVPIAVPSVCAHYPGTAGGAACQQDQQAVQWGVAAQSASWGQPLWGQLSPEHMGVDVGAVSSLGAAEQNAATCSLSRPATCSSSYPARPGIHQHAPHHGMSSSASWAHGARAHGHLAASTSDNKAVPRHAWTEPQGRPESDASAAGCHAGWFWPRLEPWQAHCKQGPGALAPCEAIDIN